MEAIRRPGVLPAAVASACPLDCPDACSLEVQVDEGRVVAVGGSRVNPLTAGYICAKVRRLPEHVHGPLRVAHPRIREGAKGQGRFRRASWDEALSLVAGRLSELAARGEGEAILPVSYGGSNGYLSQDNSDARLFARLGASRLARTVCSAPTMRVAGAMYGKMAGIAIDDYAHAKLAIVWGGNPSATGIHLIPHLQTAQKAGGRLVVVDPRRTRVAAMADLHLAIRPGTDLPVALAVHRFLFESGAADRQVLAEHTTGAEELERRAAPWTFDRAAEIAGVPASEIETLARWYAESSPAAIRCCWGLERNRNGGSAAAAILALPAVGGKFRVRAGGYTLSNSASWNLDAGRDARAEKSPAREINMNLTGETLLARERPVRALFVYNCNPLVTLPAAEKVRAGLSREDLFTVVFDPIMTETALYADVVLPATTFLERTEFSRGYGAYVLHETRPAIPPVGESRPNHEVFAELCHRTGVARPGDPETAEEIIADILQGHAWADRIRGELHENGSAFPPFGQSPIQFVDAFPRHADRKIRLVPAELDEEAPAGLYGYRDDPATDRRPLALISPATDRTISSTLGELHTAIAELEIHPDDAAPRGIRDGGRVRVYDGRAEVLCLAKVHADIRPGVVCLPKGLWSHNTFGGTTASALAPDTLTDLGGGACFNDARVEVEPFESAV
jgi:anaerobic selenocysteine-containing dehydrogenase